MTAKSKVHEHNKKDKAHSKYGMISQNSNIKRHTKKKRKGKGTKVKTVQRATIE